MSCAFRVSAGFLLGVGGSSVRGYAVREVSVLGSALARFVFFVEKWCVSRSCFQEFSGHTVFKLHLSLHAVHIPFRAKRDE